MVSPSTGTGSDAGATQPGDAGPVTGRGPGATLWLLRAVAATLAALVAAQPLLAGRYLDGDMDAITAHGLNANALTAVSLFQVVAALAYVWPGRGRVWPLAAAVVVFLAVSVQTGLGYTRTLSGHVPLGVALVAAQAGLAVWVCRPGARLSRAGKGNDR